MSPPTKPGDEGDAREVDADRERDPDDLDDVDDHESDDYDDAEFTISSDDAYVAAVTIACHRCRRPFEAICIFCRSGTCFGEPLQDFTIANLQRVDATLATGLGAWPHFHSMGSSEQPGEFANHCPNCGAVHEDHLLHDEPQDPFFDIAHASPGRIRLTPLRGPIQLSGDEHYQVE